MRHVPETMRALVAYGINDYCLETDFPTPECGDDDIIIKTEACGICAGDLKCQRGVARFWGEEGQPSYVKPPFIPGHEFFGRIVEVGKNVTEYKLGERVTADQIVPCGKCRFCKSGRYSLCQPHDLFGFKHYLNGGMAEYVRYPKNAVIHRVPENMSVEDAMLIEPYSCSKHAVDRAQITNEDVVVLAGAGTLGLGMVTYLRMKNPEKLIVLDCWENRLEKAREFGADLVMNPNEEDVYARIMELTDGYGCDVYIEATGNAASVNQGMKLIRKQGRFVEFSVMSQNTSLDWSVIGDEKELDVYGVHLSPYCYDFVIDRICSGELKTNGVVSSLYALEDWEEAFEHATGRYGDYKVGFRF